MQPPPAAALDAAIGWLSERSPNWTVITRAVHASSPVFVAAGLQPALVLPVLEWQIPLPPLPDISGLDVGPDTSIDEVRSVYLPVFGADLAPLVADAHLRAASYLHLVARLEGRAVGCAEVRWAAGTAYISGVGVLPDLRGRGIATALSAAATITARARCAGPVWLLAEPDVAPIYRRLGYAVVDEHVHLRRPTPTPLGQQREGVHVNGPYDTEVPVVNGRDLRHAEPLRRGHD